jgi:mono/diheme cytochrome c family protein
VEGPGHCGECHTPRDLLGGLQLTNWLSGAPAMDGEGKVPNITPAEKGLADWSEKDIAYFFESGFLPDFDMVGGSMVKVQENLARLPESDRKAIAAYLKAIPAE